MAVAYFVRYLEVDTAVAERIAARVSEQIGGKPPAGGIYHAEGPIDEGGWWTFDVWASADDFAAFRELILQPALDAANVAPAEQQQFQVTWESSQMGSG